MSDPVCVRCGRPIHDGGYVCAQDADVLKLRLAEVAKVAGEAWATIARLDVIGEGGGLSEAPEPQDWTAAYALAPMALPVDLDAAQRWDAAVSELSTWVRHIVEEQGVQMPTARRHALACLHASCRLVRKGLLLGPACPPAPKPEHPVEVMAGWLIPRLEWLRRRPEASEAWDGMHSACRDLLRVVDRHADRWYAGPCGAKTMEGECEEELHPIAGAKTVRCRCGTEHDLAARREWLLEQAEETWHGAEAIAQFLEWLGLGLVTSSQIRGYAHRGRLAPHPESLPGRPRYRIGSVRELVDQQRQLEKIRKLRKAVAQAEREERERIHAAVPA